MPSVSCAELWTGTHADTSWIDRSGLVLDDKRTYGMCHTNAHQRRRISHSYCDHHFTAYRHGYHRDKHTNAYPHSFIDALAH